MTDAGEIGGGINVKFEMGFADEQPVAGSPSAQLSSAYARRRHANVALTSTSSNPPEHSVAKDASRPLGPPQSLNDRCSVPFIRQSRPPTDTQLLYPPAGI